MAANLLKCPDCRMRFIADPEAVEGTRCAACTLAANRKLQPAAPPPPVSLLRPAVPAVSGLAAKRSPVIAPANANGREVRPALVSSTTPAKVPALPIPPEPVPALPAPQTSTTAPGFPAPPASPNAEASVDASDRLPEDVRPALDVLPVEPDAEPVQKPAPTSIQSPRRRRLSDHDGGTWDERLVRKVHQRFRMLAWCWLGIGWILIFFFGMFTYLGPGPARTEERHSDLMFGIAIYASIHFVVGTLVYLKFRLAVWMSLVVGMLAVVMSVLQWRDRLPDFGPFWGRYPLFMSFVSIWVLDGIRKLKRQGIPHNANPRRSGNSP